MRVSTLITFATTLTTVLASSWDGFSLQKSDNTRVRTEESWDWTNCGEQGDPVEIWDIKVSPDPPQPGQNLTVTATGFANEVIQEGATADVVVKLGLVKLLSKTFDVCEEARNANASIQCPVEKGEHTVVQTVLLPKEIPRAKFTILVRGYTVEEEPMLCADLKVNFMKRPF